MVGLHRGNGDHFSCSIYYKKTYENEEGPIDLFSTSSNSQYIYMLDDIAGIGGHSLTAIELMEFAEEAMWEDHNRRNGNDWDNDDDQDEDPIEPYSPTGIVELESIIA